MNKIKRYAEIKQQIKDLSEELKELEADVFSQIASVDGEKLETDYATYTIMYRPKWQYSKELTEKEQLLKDKLKVMKKEEELNGKAEKISDGGSLRCQIKQEATS